MVERNMCNAVKRSIVVPPGSKATSRANGSRRNLGGPTSGRHLLTPTVRIGKARSRRLMMHGRGKSDSAIVAVKPVNNAEQSAAEPGAHDRYRGVP
jgi:hypothetical protein